MKNAVFERAYKRLNKKQKEAVDSIEGPVMVIAGPGTGKTSILTLRIANILKKTDTPPSGILAITFTDAGVKAMRDKLREIIGARADEVKICTFHSFASSIIAELSEHFPHLVGAIQMTDVEIEIFIREILKDKKFSDLRPLGNPDLYVRGIVSTISNAKREAYTPEMVREFAEKESKRIEEDENSISTRGETKGQLKAEAKKSIEKCSRTVLFSEVYGLYEARKREERRMDYDDLIVELLVAFRKDELLLRLIQERFLYIHIDEHQDTNDSQNLLVFSIANFFETPNVFIVGDEKQAIYRFQGASVDNFLKFQNRWSDMKIISLETNYRSHEAILDASFSMIEENYVEDEHKNLRIRLKSESRHTVRPVEIVTAPDEESLDLHLVHEVREILKKDKGGTIAVIVRRNRELDSVLRLFEQNNISVSSERKIDIFSHPAGLLFFNIIEYIADPTHFEALSKTLVAGLWGISFDDMAVLVRNLRSGRISDIEKYIPALRSIRKEFLSDAPVGFLIHTASLSGYTDAVARELASIEVWRGITELAETVARQSNIRSPLELINALLAYRASAETRSVKVSIGVADYPVHAMTAHGSKGLEFDYVFLPYATDQSWIGRTHSSFFVLPKMRDHGDDIRDVRRLFYVAMTRARKHVEILVPQAEAGGRELSSLRFLSEIDSKHVIETKIDKRGGGIHSSVKMIGGTNSKLIDYAKRVLTDTGLSVTALNHFSECPSKFLYQSILKIPQAPSAVPEKGTVMHDAFSRVWREKIRDMDVIEAKILEAVSDFEKKSLLAQFEIELVATELRTDAPIVARALHSHFATKATVFAEEWSKTVYEGVYRGKKILIPLHGKLDAVLDIGKEVLVFDYKTKQAMTPSAIKGETKNDNGDYFRQLVFYRLLLERDERFKNKKITPALVFVSPDEKGRCPIVGLPIVPKDMKDIFDRIQSLIESVWSGRVLTDFCDDSKCEWCSLKKFTVH